MLGTGNELLMLVGVIWALVFEFMALRQKKVMQLLIFSTIAAVGYIIAGLAATTSVGAVGGVAEIFNFVVMRALVFLAAAYLISEAQASDIDDLKGVGKKLPVATTLLAFGVLALMSLSPFKASISKLLIFYSAVESGSWLVLALGFLALLFQACYFLRLIQKLIFAPYEGTAEIKEKASVLLILAGLVAAGAAWMGISGHHVIEVAKEYAMGLRGGEIILPQLESHQWPELVMIPYLGAFVAFLLGLVMPALRNLAVFLITLVPVLYLSFDPAWGIAELGPLQWFFAFFMSMMTFLIATYSIGFMGREKSQGRFYFWLVFLSASLVGLGISKSLGDFYVFWEMMTISSYFLALQRETKEARQAALTYFLAAASAGYLLLTGILAIGVSKVTGALTVEVAHSMFEFANLDVTALPLPVTVVAILFFIGLGVKAEVFPLYGWVPKLYQEAPAPVSALFASALSKAAVIGLLVAFFVILGTSGEMPGLRMWFAWLGALTMILGVAGAMLQSDMQKLLAYHSISQMGYVITGIALGSALGVAGGVFHAINHMLFKGLLFLCAGAVLMQTGCKDLDKLGGLARKMPVTTFAVVIAAFAISGVPPFNGFASKWMIYQAGIAEGTASGAMIGAIAMIASTGTLASFIKFIHTAFYGQLPEKFANAKEVPFIMQLPMLILAGLCTLFGVMPGIPLGLIQAIEGQIGLPALAPESGNLLGLVTTYNAGWMAFVILVFGVGLFLLFGIFSGGKQRDAREVPIYAGGKEAEPNNFKAGDIQIGAIHFFPAIHFLLEEFFHAWSFLGKIFAPIGKIFDAEEDETVERREHNVDRSVGETA